MKARLKAKCGKARLALPLLACGLLSTGHALAGTELSVKGRILPAACRLELGGGVTDTGTLSRSDLSEADVTFVRVPDIPLSIVCQTPTKVAFQMRDNRAGTAFPGLQTTADVYGLGAPGGKKTGSYRIFVRRTVSDDSGRYIVDRHGTGIWEAADNQPTLHPSSLYAWGAPGGVLPQAVNQIDLTLGFAVALPKASDLDLSREIKIDGSATMELIYL